MAAQSDLVDIVHTLRQAVCVWLIIEEYKMLVIDGRHGEGGGQVLRTSLSWPHRGQAVRDYIRGSRKNPT